MLITVVISIVVVLLFVKIKNKSIYVLTDMLNIVKHIINRNKSLNFLLANTYHAERVRNSYGKYKSLKNEHYQIL